MRRRLGPYDNTQGVSTIVVKHKSAQGLKEFRCFALSTFRDVSQGCRMLQLRRAENQDDMAGDLRSLKAFVEAHRSSDSRNDRFRFDQLSAQSIAYNQKDFEGWLGV
jgi:hypothetical protein